MTDSNKTVDTSWKGAARDSDLGFYVLIFAVVGILGIWVESAVIIAWWNSWWWAVVPIVALVVVAVVLTFRHMATPKFEPVPEPLLNQPWKNQQAMNNIHGEPVTPGRSYEGGYHGLDRNDARSTMPEDEDQQEDRERPIAGQAALESPRRPSGYRGLSKSKNAEKEQHYCPTCGKPTPSGYPYCRKCGAELPE
jgi:hypothetical protein